MSFHSNRSTNRPDSQEAAFGRSKFEEHENDDVYAGFDVADGGGDRNALALRKGVVLCAIDQWGERDTGVTARKAIDGVSGHKRVSVQYDSIGVGAGVKAETNRLNDDGLSPRASSSSLGTQALACWTQSAA